MPIGKILAYIFAIIALLFEGFFGIISFVGFIIQIILLSFALYFLTWIFRRKNISPWYPTIRRYILTLLTTIGFFTSIFLSFIGYHNMVPGTVSDITLSYSGQEVIFLEMSHIATPEFYISKHNKLQSLTQSGYTILFEGVKPGTPENQTIFDQSLGFTLTPALYAEVGNFLGLTNQDNHSLYADIGTGSLVSVDLSIDEIVRLMGTGGVVSSTGSLPDLSSEVNNMRAILTQKEQIFVGWIGRGLLNWSLKRSDDLDSLLVSSDQSKLFTTIIDRRNDRIIEYILAHPKEKIAIVYGALHFNGVYEALQRVDKNWKVIDIQNSAPY